jgi:hypothetical protein
MPRSCQLVLQVLAGAACADCGELDASPGWLVAAAVVCGRHASWNCHRRGIAEATAWFSVRIHGTYFADAVSRVRAACRAKANFRKS